MVRRPRILAIRILTGIVVSRGFQSRKLEPTWTQLAREINGRVTIAEVNCQEHSLLCMQEGVTGYPMMFYYDGRGTKTQYTGERNLVRLQTFAEECQDAAELVRCADLGYT